MRSVWTDRTVLQYEGIEDASSYCLSAGFVPAMVIVLPFGQCGCVDLDCQTIAKNSPAPLSHADGSGICLWRMKMPRTSIPPVTVRVGEARRLVKIGTYPETARLRSVSGKPDRILLPRVVCQRRMLPKQTQVLRTVVTRLKPSITSIRSRSAKK